MAEPDDITSDPNLFVDDETGDDGVWHDFKMVTTFPLDPGIMQIPVAGELGTECMFVNTAAPVMRKVVSWMAAKLGAIPDVPDPAAIGDNDVFMGSVIGIPTQVLMANGLTYVWSISGTYTYGLRKPIYPQFNGLPTGTSPVDTAAANENPFPKENFATDLLTGTDDFVPTTVDPEWMQRPNP